MGDLANRKATRIGKGNRFGSRNDYEKRLPQLVRALRLSGYKQVKTAIVPAVRVEKQKESVYLL